MTRPPLIRLSPLLALLLVSMVVIGMIVVAITAAITVTLRAEPAATESKLGGDLEELQFFSLPAGHRGPGGTVD